jgi:hypothetical protein
LCFATTDGLFFATADWVATKQSEPDTASKQSAANTLKRRGMIVPPPPLITRKQVIS